MSLSCSDLLCGEDSSIIFSGGGEDSQEYPSDVESRLEDSIAGLLEDERDLAEISSPLSPCQSIDASSRAESVAWILKVQRCYGFQTLTAYLSVNYFDRFLHSHYLPKMNGWPLQLLAVACLSIAAKLEEPLVPSLFDLQVEGAKFIFEARNVMRMELLVLRVLDWRLHSISPFWYLGYFAVKVDPTRIYTGFLISRAKEIIVSAIQETSFLEYRPSCIAAASILCAANQLPNFSFITAQHAESWTHGLQKDNIMSCHQLIQQTGLKNRPKKQQPKVVPQLRITSRSSITTTTTTSIGNSSSPLLSSSNKRRKLNNTTARAVDGDNEKRI